MPLAATARRIAWGKFTNAGQTCVAPDYVLATPDVAQVLAERIALAVTEFYGEDPQASHSFARIINERHFDRLSRLLPQEGDADDPAGQIVCGGQTDRVDRYIAPTVLFGTSPDAPVMGEEIFGPILPVIVGAGRPRGDRVHQRAQPSVGRLRVLAQSEDARRVRA